MGVRQDQFVWEPQPQAGQFVEETLAAFCAASPSARAFAERLLRETGTRLRDWLDHLALPGSPALEARLVRLGFVPSRTSLRSIWEHRAGLFPALELSDSGPSRLAIKVESVADFLRSHQLDPTPGADAADVPPAAAQLRKTCVCREGGVEWWVVERHGFRGWDPPEIAPTQAGAARQHAQTFRQRPRKFAADAAGFAQAQQLLRAAVQDLGPGWAADLFFAAEREFWTSRNRVAQVQKARQDALGLGWANHDHHTYRSSREQFARLIGILEELGVQCRERFYAGREAGWGAQVLEQPESSVVVFADVDLAPEEVTGDFAHEPLAALGTCGTVGLWCQLHGEAFLQAGLHHLECRFDFAEARAQLEQAGCRCLPPFTDLPYLKQAFAEPEVWPVDPPRIQAALAAGLITRQQAEQFARAGAIGSHLEILQRDAGYKGFNQSGINAIIRETDPRRRQWVA